MATNLQNVEVRGADGAHRDAQVPRQVPRSSCLKDKQLQSSGALGALTSKQFYTDTTGKNIPAQGVLVENCYDVPQVPHVPRGTTPLHGSDLTPLVNSLLSWGIEYHPKICDLILDNAADRQYCLRWVGRLWRERCKADPEFVWLSVSRHSNDLLTLAPYLGELSWGEVGLPEEWGKVAGKLGWREWIKAAKFAAEVL